MNELNSKGERRKVHVNLTTTFFSYIPVKKRNRRVIPSASIEYQSIEKAPCLVITVDYYTISLHTVYTGTILE